MNAIKLLFRDLMMTLGIVGRPLIPQQTSRHQEIVNYLAKEREKEPQSSQLPEYGDLMTLDEFVQCVECGGLIDWDGTGYYSDGKVLFTNRHAYPSQIRNGNIERNFTHVIWFNK